jgi:ribosome-associated protein
MHEKSIFIPPDIIIPETEFNLEFVHASGPGGQNVNKVSSAVLLRFDTNSQLISEEIRASLIQQNKKQITKDGILVIKAQRYRTQDKNRGDAIQRLIKTIKRAAEKPRARKKTIVPAKSKKKRLENKRRLSQKKHLRKQVIKEE